MDAYVTTRDAAGRLGVTVRRVQAMLQSGRLKGRKVGRDWMVDRKDLARVARMDRRPGRPAPGRPAKKGKG